MGGQVVGNRYQKVLIQSEMFGVMVPVNHNEVDGLIGQLMQMCDLTGDPVQRKALKDSIKRICREWMNSELASAGYERYQGIQDNARVIDMETLLVK